MRRGEGALCRVYELSPGTFYKHVWDPGIAATKMPSYQSSTRTVGSPPRPQPKAVVCAADVVIVIFYERS